MHLFECCVPAGWGPVACTDPCSCLFRVESDRGQALAPCGGGFVWVNESWQRTPGWPGRRTCHPSRRCARSCCSTTPMTPTTRCSHWAICAERSQFAKWQVYTKPQAQAHETQNVITAIPGFSAGFSKTGRAWKQDGRKKIGCVISKYDQWRPMQQTK